MKSIVQSFLFYLIGVPFLLALLITVSYIFSPQQFSSVLRVGIIMGLPALFLGYGYAKRIDDPLASKHYLLVLLPLAATIALVAVLMVISGGFVGHRVWGYFALSHIIYFPGALFASLYGDSYAVVLMPVVYESVFACTALVVWLRKRLLSSVVYKWLSLILISCLVITGVYWNRRQTVLPGDGKPFAGGYSSVDLYDYDVKNGLNKLVRLNGTSTLVLSNPKEMPVLDGAEAVVPLYHAMAQAVYQNIASIENKALETDIDAQKVNGKIVSFTNTIHGYQRLLRGEVDIFLGAKPSAKQLQEAKDMNIELELHPIAKEAFVFFVNSSNSVTSLTTSQIQDIYSGKIKNWKQVGGDNQDIQAFQRPENSGSQSMMIAFMKEKQMKTPLKEETVHGMGEIIERVAEYRNTKNAIGYSFRYYLQRMNADKAVTVLAVDGTEPSIETIQDGTYPITASLYAITVANPKKETVSQMIAWMKAEQGQELVEKVGYVPID